MNIKARSIVSVIVMAIVLGLFWLGGFGFDERGAEAVFCFISVTVFGLWGFACPLFDE